MHAQVQDLSPLFSMLRHKLIVFKTYPSLLFLVQCFEIQVVFSIKKTISHGLCLKHAATRLLAMVKAQRDPEANQGRPANFQLCVENGRQNQTELNSN